MKQIIHIDGMSCHHCEMRVEKALKEINGVKKASASATERNCIIDVKKVVAEDIIREVVKLAGYTVTSVE